MKVISIAAQKGGTGKTMTAAALAEAAAYTGKKALAVDLDTGNLSFALAADRSAGTSYDLIENGTPAADLIQHTNINGLDIIPAATDNITINSGRGSANRLKKALAPIRNKYDYIILDCPASAGEMQYNALLAADILIIPIICTGTNVQALYQFAGTVEQLQEINSDLKAAAIIANYDRRARRTVEIAESIPAALQDLNIINAGTIRTASKAGEAVDTLQKNIYEYARRTNTAKDYLTLLSFIDTL